MKMLGLAAKGLSIDLKVVDSSQAFGSCFHFLFFIHLQFFTLSIICTTMVLYDSC